MKQIIGGNWKMNGFRLTGLEFLREIKGLGSEHVSSDIVLFPPFTLLPMMADAAADAGIETGGQDVFWLEKGAFTGEISPAMLVDAGASWFIAGHSERRHVIGESDEIVRRKLEAGLETGLHGILCVGELIEERETGKTEEVVRRQVESAIEGLDCASPENFVIAYEPVWAIGTGLTATPDEADRMHSLIREWVAATVSRDFADNTRIQYGGSVKPDNAAEILAKPSINGALVGGASLKPESFMDIIKAVPLQE
ncbi:MAG: triose-phosphate isomerase [Candidatus Aegiribacteria sp.]|nr:triose-phosphate isomerase [Candidatus Aegiribacteria sp.]